MEERERQAAMSRQTTKEQSRAATKDGAKSNSSHRASNLEPITGEMQTGSRKGSKEQIVGSKELPLSRGSDASPSKELSDARVMRSSKEVSFHGSTRPSKEAPSRSALRQKGSTK